MGKIISASLQTLFFTLKIMGNNKGNGTECNSNHTEQTPSRLLSAKMLGKEIKIFQPKELSRKKDPKKSESKIKDEKKTCDIQKQAALDVVNAFSLSPL